jgi:UDP-glucose 4-epimerase
VSASRPTQAPAAGSTVLVTGGCGFIGSHVVDELLCAGRPVRVLDDLSVGSKAALEGRDVELVVGDVRDEGAVERAVRGVSGIVHLAAQTGVIASIEDPGADCAVNVGGTLNLLRAAIRHGALRFVFASSNAPLGEQEPPNDESKVPRPLSPYGASKLAGEAYCSAFHGGFGLGTVALRFANAYGPRSTHKTSVVAEFIRTLLAGKPLTIYGDGRQTRDFVHVADLCQAIRLALDGSAAGEVFQIGSGVETSVLDLARYLREKLGMPHAEVRFAPARSGEIRRNYSNIEKARRVLGFAPRVTLDEGLAETCAFFRESTQ